MQSEPSTGKGGEDRFMRETVHPTRSMHLVFRDREGKPTHPPSLPFSAPAYGSPKPPIRLLFGKATRQEGQSSESDSFQQPLSHVSYAELTGDADEKSVSRHTSEDAGERVGTIASRASGEVERGTHSVSEEKVHCNSPQSDTVSRSGSPQKGDDGYEFNSLDIRPAIRSAVHALGSPVAWFHDSHVSRTGHRDGVVVPVRAKRVNVKTITGASPHALGVDPSRFRFRSLALSPRAVGPPKEPSVASIPPHDVASPEIPSGLFAKEQLQRRCSCSERSGAQKPCPFCTSISQHSSQEGTTESKHLAAGMTQQQLQSWPVRLIEGGRKAVACSVM